MFRGLGGPELIVILVIVLALFGAGKLAGVGSALGTSLREFRNGLEGRSATGPDPEEGRAGGKTTS